MAPEKKKKNQNKASQEAEMTFLEHLEELRRRILYCVLAVLVSFGVIYLLFKEPLVKYFLLPMEKAIAGKGNFQFTAPAEGFLFALKICFLASIFASSPILFYQFWKFVAPGLYRQEKKYLFPFIFFSTIFFIGGAVFGYLVVFPIGFQFFARFTFYGVEINPRLSDYFSFATKMLFAFGLVFELPLIAIFFARIGLIDHHFMNRNRKYALILIFTLAAIFTPPDVVSQLLLAIPLWFLYELSVLLVWLFQPSRKSQLAG